MANGTLMKVESIAECFSWSIMQYFRPVLSNNSSYNQCSFLECQFYTGCTAQIRQKNE